MKALKTLTALLFCSLIITTTYASELIVKSNHFPIAVSVDNGPLSAADNQVSVKYIPEGYRQIAIYSMVSNAHRYAMPQLVFSSKVYIPRAVDLMAVVTQFGKFKIVNTIAHAPQTPVNNMPTPVCNPIPVCGTTVPAYIMNNAD
ncbi:MAG TPA: hypothetical protein PLO59_07790, partial [Bacteroidia bacterium]|nr:hypothetical protein [Bacteroidia bacterium]